MQHVPRARRFIPPMECRPVTKLPDGEEWQYELKLDGYRLQAVKNRGEVHLFSRNGNDFDARFPSVVEAIRALRAKEIVLDGELVALDEEGRHSFALLQKRSREPARLQFYVFDLLVYDGREILRRPLRERRQLMEAKVRMPTGGIVQSLPVLQGSALQVISAVESFGLEGVVAKRLDSIYMPGEEPGTWLKHRTQQSADFWIGGYLGSEGKRVDEILVGKREKEGLQFVESVRNGFVPATRASVLDALRHLAEIDCPFVNLPEKKGPHRMDAEKMRKVHWVKPRALVEIAFNEITSSGHLRHSRFVRLREHQDIRR